MRSLFAYIVILSISLPGIKVGAQSCQDIFKESVMASWGHQSFVSSLEKIANFTQKNAQLEKANLLMIIFKDDLRREFFMSESLARLYEDYDEPFFKGLRKRFKNIEDTLGELDLLMTLNKLVNDLKLEPTEKLPLMGYFRQKLESAQVDLLTKLESWDLQKIKKLDEKLTNYKKWLKGKEDRKYILGAIRDDVKSLEDNVFKMKYDKPNIENGLHELRRRIRWLMIQVTALSRYVEYEMEDSMPEEVETWFNEMKHQNPTFMQSSFLDLPQALVKHPAKVPQMSHAMLSYLVGTYGKMKEGAEKQIGLLGAMKDLGFSQDQKGRVMAVLNASLGVPGLIDHREISRTLQHRLMQTRLLKFYQKSLKKMNNLD